MSGTIAVAALCLPAVCEAEVTRVEIIERTEVAGGRSFGAAGPYEHIIARAHFAVDPNNVANKIITDIDLAPRNAAGLVEFSADLFVLKPRDSAKGNGTVLLEVSNRGGKRLAEMFNFAARERDPRIAVELGDEFLQERGYTMVWIGWQFDVPDRPGLMRLYPAVVKGVTGTVRSEFVPSEKVSSFWLGDRNHRPYPVLDPNDPSIQLTVRERGDGPRTVIPRDQWKFNGTTVEMAAGFEPGKFYDVVYSSQDAPVVGLGPAAVRDVMSFLKYGGAGVTPLGDEHRFVKRVLGFGMSQSSRFLRTFLYYGFNQDEQERQVFDAVWSHDAGAGRGSFNHRFAQASRDGYLMLNTFYPTDIFPFSDLPQHDPETGLNEGLLDRARAAKVVPKIFYTNGSFEYWGRNASLIHTTFDGKRDMELPATTRIYFITGAQHFAGVFPPERDDTQYLENPNDYTFALRGLLVALNDWTSSGKEPPPSAYPLIAKGQLVTPDMVQFPKIPGVTFPARWLRAWRADFGPEFRTKGIVTIDPPRVGSPFVTMVAQVDQDGIETSGMRLPAIQVPLGTYTGWNLRDPRIGAPDSPINMIGSFFPFARTKAERESRKDPRPSIAERYASRDAYLGKIRAAAQDLVRSRYLLESDVPRLVQRASEEWEYLAGDAK
ncbi:MAG: alpha/beta hydrolase domain-containing protein [Planctomycetota bacterium]